MEANTSVENNPPTNTRQVVGRPYATKRFCIRGHDTSVCGRDKRGSCELCSREREDRWSRTVKGKAARRKQNSKPKHVAQQRNAQYIRSKRLCDLVARLKNKPCTDCHGWFEPCQLDFDHVSDNKFGGGVSKITAAGYNLKVILDEIAKCELVCANCHRLRTYLRKRQPEDVLRAIE